MRDALLYKARLAMPETSEADIGARVDTLVGSLCITSAQNTQVGIATWVAKEHNVGSETCRSLPRKE